MTDHQYDIGLAVFYATYILSEVPSNLVLKRITPRIWLSFLTFAWGVISMCLGFTQNFAGFVVVRAFLGMAEGGLLPGMVRSLFTRCCRPGADPRIRFSTCPGYTRAQTWP